MHRSTKVALTVVAAAAAMALAGCGAAPIGGVAVAPAPPPAAAPAAPTAPTAPTLQLVSGTAADNKEATDSGGTPQLGSQAPAHWEQLTAVTSQLGGVGVVDVDGRTLYRFDEDKPSPPTTTCTGPCATTWPPVVVEPGGKVYLGAGVLQQQVATVTRPDGGIQLTLGGWPLYRFSGDHAAGDVNGQGVKGTWFGVTPQGKKLTGGIAPAAPSNPGPPALSLQKSAAGSVIADATGRTVYVTSVDSPNPPTVKCADTCSAGHEPVPAAAGTNVGIAGIAPGSVGSVARGDGTRQMTLEGFPLYTAAADAKPGDVQGQGNGFFALGLDGQK